MYPPVCPSLTHFNVLLQVHLLSECPSVLNQQAASVEKPWQAEVAEATLLVEALSVEASRAAVVAEVLPSSLLTGSSTAENLLQRYVCADVLAV